MSKLMIREPNVKDLPIEIQHVDATFFNRLTTKHLHPQIELAIASHGDCHYEVDGVRYDLKQGDCIFINAHHEHGTGFTPPAASIDIVYFRLNDFEDQDMSITAPALWSLLKMNDASCCVFRQHEIYKYVQHIIDEFNSKRPFYNMFVKADVFSILGILYREQQLNPPSGSVSGTALKKFTPLLDYINDHYQDKITLDVAAQILNFNKSYFSRMFKEATGRSFTEYLNEFRINRSVAYLTSGNHTITEISEMLGFSTTSYFTTVFRRYYKCTPTEFRHKISYRGMKE